MNSFPYIRSLGRLEGGDVRLPRSLVNDPANAELSTPWATRPGDRHDDSETSIAPTPVSVIAPLTVIDEKASAFYRVVLC
jgi:hypothetical protein